MALKNKIYEPDLQSDRAKNIQGDNIYIDDVNWDPLDYHYLGCNKVIEPMVYEL